MNRYAQLRDRAVHLVNEFAASGPVLVVAPERSAADEVVRLACTKALLGVQRPGFREPAPELASEDMNRLGLAPVGRVAREALAARVAARTKLTYLRPVAAFPGFPRALADTFEGLRLNRITPEQLEGCGQSGPDLAHLLSADEVAVCRPRTSREACDRRGFGRIEPHEKSRRSAVMKKPWVRSLASSLYLRNLMRMNR